MNLLKDKNHGRIRKESVVANISKKEIKIS